MSSKQKTSDEYFQEAVNAENEAVRLKDIGDAAGAKSMRQMAQGYLESALETA